MSSIISVRRRRRRRNKIIMTTRSGRQVCCVLKKNEQHGIITILLLLLLVNTITNNGRGCERDGRADFESRRANNVFHFLVRPPPRPATCPRLRKQPFGMSSVRAIRFVINTDNYFHTFCTLSDNGQLSSPPPLRCSRWLPVPLTRSVTLVPH